MGTEACEYSSQPSPSTSSPVCCLDIPLYAYTLLWGWTWGDKLVFKSDFQKRYSRACDPAKWPRVWWQPRSLQLRAFGEDADWDKVGDETFQIIRRTMFTLLGYCLFCWLTLGAPDVKLIDASAVITVPFANVDISYSAFLVVGPLLVIAIWSYLQIYVGIWSHIRREKKFGSSLPFLFNLKGFFPKYFSEFLLYWIGPITVGLFAWKALPRPEAAYLIVLCAALFGVMFWLGICRRQTPRDLLKGLGGWFGLLCAFSMIVWFPYIFGHAGFINRTLVLPSTILKDKDLRNINFYKADLWNAVLTDSNLSSSMLANANLTETDLTGAVLIDAQMMFTDMTGADLTNADLSGATLIKATLKYADLTQANLKNANLKYADLTDADLRNANLDNANLTDANLAGVQNLTRDQLMKSCVDKVSPRLVLPDLDVYKGIKFTRCR